MLTPIIPPAAPEKYIEQILVSRGIDILKVLLNKDIEITNTDITDATKMTQIRPFSLWYLDVIKLHINEDPARITLVKGSSISNVKSVLVITNAVNENSIILHNKHKPIIKNSRIKIFKVSDLFIIFCNKKTPPTQIHYIVFGKRCFYSF